MYWKKVRPTQVSTCRFCLIKIPAIQVVALFYLKKKKKRVLALVCLPTKDLSTPLENVISIVGLKKHTIKALLNNTSLIYLFSVHYGLTSWKSRLSI